MSAPAPTREQLEALKARIDAAAGPSKALAREIQCSVGGWHRVIPSHHSRGKQPLFISPEEWLGRESDGRPRLDSLHGTEMCRDVPDVTASIDAALALVERVLPGSPCSVSTYGTSKAKPTCFLHWPFNMAERPEELRGMGEAPIPPLAILSALFAALISRASAGGADVR